MAGYSQVIAFGDGLSDTGNFYQLTSGLPGGGIPRSPYDNGRFSNGPLAVEVLADTLGVSLKSYAVAGGTTGQGNQLGAAFNGTGVAGQIQHFTNDLNGTPADADALYFVWAGSADFLTPGGMTSTSTASTASSNMLGNIMELYLMGGENFLVPLMPDLSLSPAASTAGNAAQMLAHQRTLEYNGLLTSGVNFLMSITPGLNITLFDTAGYMKSQLPSLKAAGVDTKHACYNAFTGSVCANPDKHLFWDAYHPSAFADRLIGKGFAGAVGAAGPSATPTASVPEPDAVALAALGVVAVGWYARRRRGVAAQSVVAH